METRPMYELNYEKITSPRIRLIALDLDDTLFDAQGRVSQGNIDAIRYAVEKGVHVVIATGRPYSGVPFSQLEGVPVQYAMTTNGASAYRLEDRKQLFEYPMSEESAATLLEFLKDKKTYASIFSNGEGYSTKESRTTLEQLDMPDSVKETHRTTRLFLEDPVGYLKDRNLAVQKITLNFIPDGNGGYLFRDEIEAYMRGREDLSVVCGGFHNLECTKRGVDKGFGLLKLAEYLGVAPEETMAMGDSENDLAMVKAAAVGVAMANAEEIVKDVANYITASNVEDGVAKAIYEFVK